MTITNACWSRAVARELCPRDECSVAHIGHCKGRIEIHHIDGDPFNNDTDNLTSLCISHHGLVHRGKINLDAPEMPPFYISGGKRRYRIPSFHRSDTHCRRGHPFDEDNTYWWRGKKHCRTCRKAYRQNRRLEAACLPDSAG